MDGDFFTPDQPAWLADLPGFSLTGPPKPQPNLFTSALSSGYHEALGNVGSAAQALGTVTGWQGATDWGKGFARSQQEQAQAASRPDLENSWSPAGFAYGLTKSLPTFAGAIAAGGLGALAAPEAAVGTIAGAGIGELAGAAGFMLPQTVGGNVQAAEDANGGQLSPGDAAKALLMGAPEAAASAVLPGRLRSSLAAGAEGAFLPRVAGGAVKLGLYQGVVGAAETAATQQAFTPDMPVADRARQVVDAALSGGLQGAVFGGIGALRKAQAPATQGDPSSVTNDALTAATDAVIKPQSPDLLPSPEKMSPLAKAAGSPYGEASNEDLAAMAKPLAAKVDRGSDEDIQHSLIQQEIARRTAPGFAPGEVPMFTPKQMAERQPGVDATKALAAKAAGGGESDPFFQNFNAASEPELVNALSARADTYGKKAPEWFKTLANQYGVPIDGVGATPGESLVKLQDQLDKSTEARNAAQSAGKVELMRAANKEIIDLQPKISAAEKLLDMHLNADNLRDERKPPPPLSESVADSTGQLNIPGMGEATSPTAAETAGQPATATDPNQLRLLTPAEMGIPDARLAEMSKFQDLVLSQLPARVRARTEPLVRGSGAANEPELINNLKQQHQALDGATPPAPLADLLDHFGVANREGEPHDLQQARQIMVQEYQDQLNRVSTELKAGHGGQADILFNRAQEFKNTKIDNLDRLIDSHNLAADIGKQAPDIELPDRVPPEMGSYWKTMEQLKTDTQSPALQKAADTAQRAIEQRNPAARAIMQLALNRFSDEQRARVVTSKEAAAAKPAEAPPVETPALTGDAAKAANFKSALKEFLATEAGKPASPEAQAASVEKSAKALGSNLPASDEMTNNASRAGADAYRSGDVGLNDNPFDPTKNPEEYSAWRQGWRTARQPTHADVQEKPAPVPKQLDPATARAKIEAAVSDGNLAPEKLAQAQLALGSKDPAAVQQLENSWAKIEQYTGRPFNQSIAPFGRRGVDLAPAPPEIASNPDKSWAIPAAHALEGEIVSADAERALVRSYDGLGRAIYLPVDRNLGLRGQEDVRNTKVSWLSPFDKQKLIDVAKRDEAQDQARYTANPEGPFKDATQNVIGTKSADPRLVGAIGEWLHTLGIDARVLVAHSDDVRGEAGNKLGLNGPFISARTIGNMGNLGEMSAFGPRMKDFYIHVDHTKSEALQIETAAHEVGHVIFETALVNADKPTRDAIEAAYNDWFRKNSGATRQDLIMSTRNLMTAKLLTDNRAPSSTMDQKTRDYYTSKGEWFADQVSRYLTTADKGTSVVGKFFSAVAQKIRELYTAITGNKFAPDDAVKQFLDDIGPGSEKQWMTRPGARDKIPTTNETGPNTVPSMERAVHASISNVSDLRDQISDRVEGLGARAPVWLRRQALGWQTMDGIVRIGGDLLRTAKGWSDTHLARQIYTDAKNKADAISAARYRALEPKTRELVDNMLARMNDGTDIDPRKSWVEHTDLHSKSNSAELAAQHREMQGDLSRLQQAGGRQAMDSILQMTQTKRYQALSAMLHDTGQYWAQKGVQFAGHGVNPDEVYRGMTGAAGHDSPDATNLYYKNTVKTLRDGIVAHIAQKEAEASAAGLKAGGDLNDLRSRVAMVDQAMAQADKGTYVPLGRGNGHYFVSGKIALGDDKTPNPVSVKAVQDALKAKGFNNIGIFHDAASNTIMSRVEDMSKMQRLQGVFQDLEKAGHMLPGETKAGYPERIDTMAGLGPQYMHQMVEAANSMLAHVDVEPEVAEQLKQQFISRWMDMLPDHSVLQNLQQREHISGFKKDLGQTAIQAALNQSRSSTSVGMRGTFAKVSEAMRQEVQDAKSGVNSVATHDIAKELWRREAEQAWDIPRTGFDTMQNMMHTLRIGFSPPYVLTMMSQIPTLSLPELSKKFGYAQSSLALAKAAPRAFAAIKAVMSGPDRWNVGFRETALREAGIPEKDIQTLLKLDNAGGLSNSTYTTMMSDLGKGEESKLEKFKTRANVMGVYAEMFPRVITALAAGDMHDARPVQGMTREQVVSDMVNRSQFNWGAGQSSRMTGKTGPLGAASRVVFQFTSFQTKMIEKLYTEAHALLGKEGPQAQKEAGMFLAGHLLAMTALAGTMGLPAMGALAGLTDKLASTLTGKDDIDVEGLYRTWMAHTFGAGVADVLAKGLPRAAGIDLSHLGEGNIVPFTSILRDKRKFEDSSRDWFKGLAGSAVGEIGNMYTGARDMMNGDYLRGAIKVLPEGFKGLAEGYYFYDHGYIDKNGTKYPLQPGAMDILTATLGLDPANLAQYDEANRIRMGLMAERQFREQNIETHLLRGVQDPGSADMKYWTGQATQYAVDHPGLGNPLANLQTTLMKNVMRGGTAAALGTPLGVSGLDTSMQGRTGFLNPK